MAGIIGFFIGGFLRIFAMGLFSGNAYEKGYKDGFDNGTRWR